MSTSKTVLLLCLMAAAATAQAAAPLPPSGDASKNPDVTPYVIEVDADKNGCMSLKEWQTAGAPMSSYEGLHDKKGCVTAEIMRTTPAPAGVDLNGDGKLTLAEMKAFDKKMAPMMGGKGAPPQGQRSTIPAAERALAMWEVQNTMSKHAYYHAAGLNLEEVDALWVDENGPHATTATFASPAWVMSGIETVKAAYGEVNQKNREKALEALSKVNPKVKNVPENLGAGHEWAMHANTTPVIEIAGDGKTAKGIWYSPGMGLMTSVKDGKADVRGTFFWEKYGGDFVKENGMWKIWHLQMAYDFTPALDEKWLDFDKKGMAEAGERTDEMPAGFSKPKYSYPPFSPERPSIIYPKFPEPYYTFDETFSY